MENILVVKCPKHVKDRKGFVEEVVTDILTNTTPTVKESPVPFQSTKFEYYFKPRNEMETDLDYIQLNMSVCLIRQKLDGELEVFTNRKIGTSTERRLMGRLNVLIGGHCSEGDVSYSSPSVYSALLNNRLREFQEEVVIKLEDKEVGLSELNYYKGSQYFIVYSEEDEVSRYHAGLYSFLVVPEGAEVNIKENEKLEGRFYSLDELENDEALDGWSKIIVEELRRL